MRRIYLIGFMGSGKTTLGHILAKRLKTKFIDLDEWIELKEKRSIATLFQTDGEAYFRDLEYKALNAIKSEAVIATGGGIIENTKALNYLKKQDTVFYLKTSFETCLKRIQAPKERQKRPLARLDSNQLKARFNLRASLYTKVASATLQTDSQLKEILNEALSFLDHKGI